jgi:ribosomal protein S12 methylthiotransferase accessory factor
MSASFDPVMMLRPSLSVASLGSDVVVLLGEQTHFVLKGSNVRALVALVDGRRTRAQIVEAASSEIDEMTAWTAMDELESSGLLVPGSAAPGSAPLAAPEAPGLVRVRLLTSSVASDAVDGALRIAGATPTQTGDAMASVVVVDDFLHPEVQQELPRIDTPCLMVQLGGAERLVGPVLHPSGSCASCLAFWLRAGHPVHDYLSRRAIDVRPATSSSLRAGHEVVLRVAALAAARLTNEPAAQHPLARHILAFGAGSLELKRHAVVRRRQCPACGDPSWMTRQGSRPVELQAVPKRRCDDGGYRCQDPSETYERLEHLVSSPTGPVAFVRPMPGRSSALRPLFMSAYYVCAENAELDGAAFVRLCAGKGKTREQARAGALCEALERYSSVYQGDEASARGSLVEMGEQAVDPRTLYGFSERQYASRDPRPQVSSSGGAPAPPVSWSGAACRVPERLDADTPISWTPAWSLTHGKRRFVPLSFCFAESPQSTGVSFCPYNGNGVAAGGCLEEAILQGLFELVERDAVAIWWYNQVQRPRVDLASFSNEYFDGLLDDYTARGWQAWVLDLTHDLGIPTFVALAGRAKGEPRRLAAGFGSHVDPTLAVQRALTELNQLFDSDGLLERHMLDATQMADPSFLLPAPDVSPSRYDGFRWAVGANLRADVEMAVARLASAGLEVIVVDKTRPDIGLSVAHVIVPGLRHFWPRLAPGRLYDVPVKLGWTRVARAEHELNPSPLLL